jgi:hypothetical protein
MYNLLDNEKAFRNFIVSMLFLKKKKKKKKKKSGGIVCIWMRDNAMIFFLKRKKGVWGVIIRQFQ